MFQILQNTFNNTFQDLAPKSEGRLKFFMLWSLIISLISAVTSFFCFQVLGLVIDFWPDFGVYYTPTLWDRFLSTLPYMPASTFVAYIFLMRYYMAQSLSADKRYRIDGFFSKLKPSDWFFYFVGVAVVTLLTMLLVDPSERFGFDSHNKLDLLFDFSTSYRSSLFSIWLTNVKLFLVQNIQVFIVAIYIINAQKKKVNTDVLRQKWKQIVLLAIVFLVAASISSEFIQLIQKLIVGLLGIPFDDPYIRLLLLLVFSLVLTGVIAMIFSKIVFYLFNQDLEEVKAAASMDDESDLLDQ